MQGVNEAAFKTVVGSAADNLGTLTIAADGTYTYTVDNTNVQHLNTGVNKTESFSVESIDGTKRSVSFTIEGVDEPATPVSLQAKL